MSDSIGKPGAPPSTGPVTTAAELVRLRAEDDSTGLLFEGKAWTWRQVVSEAELRADLLISLRGEGPFHVAVLLENTPEYLFLLAGAALAGAVIVGVNPTRRGTELAGDIRRTDCQLLITDTAHLGLVDHLDLGIGADRLLVMDEEAYGHRLAGLRPQGTRPDRDIPSPRRTSSSCSSSPRGPPEGPRRCG